MAQIPKETLLSMFLKSQVKKVTRIKTTIDEDDPGYIPGSAFKSRVVNYRKSDPNNEIIFHFVFTGNKS